MLKFRNIFAAALLAAPPLPTMAEAPPWAPIIGKWRAADYGGCGIDDVRFGRITSVSEQALLTDKIFCALEGGAATDDGYRLEAICEVGTNYYMPLTFNWRLTSTTEAVIDQDGFERRLIRCEGETK